MNQKATTSEVRVGPLYRERIDLGIGSELKVYVGSGLGRLKVTCCWGDGRRKRVPVSRCHRDKRIGVCVCSVFNLSPYGCWVLENRVFHPNEAF